MKKHDFAAIDLVHLEHVAGGAGLFDIGTRLGDAMGRIGFEVFGTKDPDPGGNHQVVEWMRSELSQNQAEDLDRDVQQTYRDNPDITDTPAD